MTFLSFIYDGVGGHSTMRCGGRLAAYEKGISQYNNSTIVAMSSPAALFYCYSISFVIVNVAKDAEKKTCFGAAALLV